MKRESLEYCELDTVVSSTGKSKTCLSTFVDRKSRYLISNVMENRNLTTFKFHCFKVFEHISSNLVKTFTVYRCKKFVGYNVIEKKLNIDFYLSDTYSS